MTVNKIGRPSKALERKAEILHAAASVVAKEGLAATTVGKVAEAAGLQRTLLLHYFKDRQSLIDAFVEQVAGLYGELQILGERSQPIERRVARAFEPGFYASPDDLAVWVELVAHAARDPELKARLRELWNARWLPTLERELAQARPRATPAQIAAVAYALACLVEAHWTFHLVGVATPARQRHVQAMAMGLVDTLPKR
jgi:AcrR family transcriptional regulator